MNLKIILFVGMATIAGSPADAAYLNVADWYGSAVTPTLMAGGSLVAMPDQSVVVTDYYGSYTAATAADPVDVSHPPYGSNPYGATSDLRRHVGMSDGMGGSLKGHFECVSPISGCLGAHTITYTLPFEITGLAGDLDLGIWYLGSLSVIPFFELTDAMGGPYSYPDHPYGTYEGFWGTTFEPTKSLTIVWTPGLGSADAGANFSLSNLLVLTGGASSAVTAVPEPASMAIFGVGLAGLLTLRGRRNKARSPA